MKKTITTEYGDVFRIEKITDDGTYAIGYINHQPSQWDVRDEDEPDFLDCDDTNIIPDNIYDQSEYSDAQGGIWCINDDGHWVDDEGKIAFPEDELSGSLKKYAKPLTQEELDGEGYPEGADAH